MVGKEEWAMFRACILIAGLTFVSVALFNAFRHICGYLYVRKAKGPMRMRIWEAKCQWPWW